MSTPRWKKRISLILEDDSAWLSYSQDTFVVSFWSFFLRLIERLKKLTRPCQKGHFMADLYHAIRKWPFKAPFAHLRLADTELAAPCSYRQIKVLVVFRCIEKFNPVVAGDAILWPILALTLVKKKTNLGHSWRTILADPITVRTHLTSQFEAYFFCLSSNSKTKP